MIVPYGFGVKKWQVAVALCLNLRIHLFVRGAWHLATEVFRTIRGNWKTF